MKLCTFSCGLISSKDGIRNLCCSNCDKIKNCTKENESHICELYKKGIIHKDCDHSIK